MRVVFVFILCSFFANEAHSIAWNHKKKHGYHSFGIIYEPGHMISNTGNLGYDRNYHFSSKNSKISQIANIEYGITDDITLLGNLSIAQKKDEIDISIDKLFKTKMNFEYVSTSANFGISKNIAKDNFRVLSTQIYFSPGEYNFSPFNNIYIKEKENIGLGLSYGMSFKAKNQELYNFFEWSLGNKLYFEGNNEQFFNVKLGMRPLKHWSFEVGLYNSFGIVNIERKPFAGKLEQMAQSLPVSSYQKNFLIQRLHEFNNTKSYTNSSKIQLKVAREIFKKDNFIEVELFSDLLTNHVLKGSGVIVSYSKKF